MQQQTREPLTETSPNTNLSHTAPKINKNKQKGSKIE